MRFITGIVYPALCLVLSCAEPQITTVENRLHQCAELDSLFDTINQMDSVLAKGESWETCNPFLQAALNSLAHNLRPDNKDCNYLDQHYQPEQPRLLFVETLRDRIETDTVPTGIYYLLRLRGLFNEDPEITEFFSEELGNVAYSNPSCYLDYLRLHPDQEVMLLYSTRWNALDSDTLRARFRSLDASESVLTFLESLDEQKGDGI